MYLLREPHLLQDVVVVVQSGLVDADCDRHALLQKHVEGRHAALQPQIRAWIGAYGRAGLGQDIYVGLGEPYAVSAGDLGAEKAEVREMGQRRLAPVSRAVHLLVDRLLQMYVDSRGVACGELLDGPEHLVGAPVDVVRADEDAGAVRLLLVDKLGGHGQVVLQGDRPAAQIVSYPLGERRRKRSQKTLVVFVHEVVLVPVRKRECDAHPGVLVGLDDACARLVQARVRRQPGHHVIVHDRGYARLNHLHGAVQGVQVGVDVAQRPACDDPCLQRHVQRAELKRRETDMMMGVHQSGYHGEIGGAYLFVGLVPGPYFLVGTDLDDLAVPLEHRAILDYVAGVLIDDARDDVSAAYYR